MDLLLDTFGDHAGVVLGVLVFLAVGTLSFSAMTVIRVRGAVKRRAAGITLDGTAHPPCTDVPLPPLALLASAGHVVSVLTESAA